MARPRRNDRPAERTVAYVDPVVLDEINKWSGGLSLGEAVEKLWREREARPAAPRSAAPLVSKAVADLSKANPPAKPVPHAPENKGWGIMCSNCGAVKGSTAKWAASCPGKVI